MKDVFLQYDFDKQNLIRGGYFIHQYGFQSSTSSSFKETMEEPQSNAVFNNDRMIGVMYEYNGQKFLGTASIVVETDAMKNTTDQTGNQGIGGMTRLLYRPFAVSAGIYGGYLNDWALCYNFYLNKYMIWRVRASYTKVTNRSGYADNECGILETRLQVKF